MTWTDWIAREQRLLGFAALGVVIVCSSLANVFLKLGARVPAEGMLFGLLAWQTVAGVACFGSAVIAYSWALKQFDLHVAQIIVSLQYVSVILLSFFFLGERITPNEWAGIGLIGLGLFVCTR